VKAYPALVVPVKPMTSAELVSRFSWTDHWTPCHFNVVAGDIEMEREENDTLFEKIPLSIVILDVSFGHMVKVINIFADKLLFGSSLHGLACGIHGIIVEIEPKRWDVLISNFTIARSIHVFLTRYA
jgi:hypothetical protein